MPARVAFVEQPSLIEAGRRFPAGISAYVVDSAGELVRTATTEISLSLQGPAGGASLTGTTTIQATAGIARFDDLRIDATGAGNTLTATAEGLASATSVPFDVVRPFALIDAGGFHTCGLTEDNTVYCWGDGFGGTLGDGPEANRAEPRPVAGNVAFSALSAGYFTCGLDLTGVAYCWGRNSTTPVAVTPAPAFSRIATGNGLACALTVDGRAYCWGSNLYGSLGDGTTVDHNEPVAVLGGLTFDTLTVGAWHTCAVTAVGEAYCWGVNATGALGDGTRIDRRTPVLVAGDLRFSQVSAGRRHSCGLTTDGDAYCWGSNDHGQLGTGGVGDSPVPVPVQAPAHFVAIAAGGDFSCALASTGAAYCWGLNVFGNLGDGSFQDRHVPTLVQSTVPFEAISAGINQHACALRVGGAAYCWGLGSSGQLGRGMPYNRDTPTSVLAP